MTCLLKGKRKLHALNIPELLQEELEIKAFIHEYNRCERATHSIMAYWSRKGFGLLSKEDGTQATRPN